MIRQNLQKFAVVTADTAQGFELQLNKKMEELTGKSPVVHFNMNQGHCAYIHYEEEVVIPEDVRDEYNLKGISYVCGECPCFVMSKDHRVKHHDCSKTGSRVKYDTRACLYLYQQLASGEVKI